MTMTEHPQRERTQHDQAGQANQAHAANLRQAAAASLTAVAAARAENKRANHLDAEENRWSEAIDILAEQMTGRADMSVLGPKNALRHLPGSGDDEGLPDRELVLEFVLQVQAGQLPKQVIRDMHTARLELHLASAVRHADSSHQQAHRLENAATVPAALPAAQPALNGAPLPKRVPGPRPSEPPMFPPAPPESPAEQTGAIFSRLRENGHDIPAEIERAARKDHGSSLETRVADPKFAATAIPAQRMGDTQRLPLDEVLGHLELDDAGAVDEPEPLPFAMAASTAAPGSRHGDASARSGVGDAGDGDVDA